MSLNFILLTHWGRVMHICIGKSTIIASDNGLSPERRQAIIWTNAGILLIGPLGTNFNEILIGIHTFSFKKMHLKMSSAKWRPFCLGHNVLIFLWHFPGTMSYTRTWVLLSLQWLLWQGLPQGDLLSLTHFVVCASTPTRVCFTNIIIYIWWSFGFTATLLQAVILLCHDITDIIMCKVSVTVTGIWMLAKGNCHWI